MTVLLALAAALVYGAADFCGGLASRRMSAAAVVVLSQVAGAAVLLAAWLALPNFGHIHAIDIELGAAAGIAGAVAIAALYAALSTGRMGVVSPITAVVGASVPMLAGFARGEHPAVEGAIGLALAFVAVGLVAANLDGRRVSLREPGVGLALLSGLAIGGLYVLLARGHHDGVFALLAAARVTSVLLLCGYAAVRRETLRPAPGLLPLVLFTGALDMGANVLYVLASSAGMLAIAAVLTSLYPASTVFLARIFLHERLSGTQWAGVALAGCGVALIALSP